MRELLKKIIVILLAIGFCITSVPLTTLAEGEQTDTTIIDDNGVPRQDYLDQDSQEQEGGAQEQEGATTDGSGSGTENEGDEGTSAPEIDPTSASTEATSPVEQEPTDPPTEEVPPTSAPPAETPESTSETPSTSQSVTEIPEATSESPATQPTTEQSTTTQETTSSEEATTKTFFTYEDSEIIVEVTLDEEAALPAETQFYVRQVFENSLLESERNAYLWSEQLLNQYLEKYEMAPVNTFFYEMYFEFNGQKIRADKELKVKIWYKQDKVLDEEATVDNVRIFHIDDNDFLGEPEVVDTNARLEVNELGSVTSAEFQINRYLYTPLIISMIESKEAHEERLAKEEAEGNEAEPKNLIYMEDPTEEETSTVEANSSEEETKLITGEEGNEDETEETEEPVPTRSYYANWSGDVSATIILSNPAQIPDTAEVVVTPVTPDAADYNYDAYIDALNNSDESITYTAENTLLYDIKFVDTVINEDGEEQQIEYEPEEGTVQVILQFKNNQLSNEINAEDNQNVTVNHLVTDAEADTTDITAGDISVVGVDAAVQLEGTDTVIFNTDSFSVYAFSYTVDFHWDANGKMYDFTIPGGGFVSFYNLVEALGIEVNDTNTEEDEIQELVDAVENIEFSDPELVSVSKIEEATTVGAIKERLGLEYEYSAELTEEQIAEINAQEAKVGDWALISLKAFETEESLTVTMKNGDQFVMKVTDAQVNSPSEIDENKEYILYTKVGSQYYVLKTDGTTEVKSQNELDGLDIQYKWKITTAYTDWSGNSYYHVLPASGANEALDLSWFNNPLVKDGKDNNVMIEQNGNTNTFFFSGYNHVVLSLNNNGAFSGMHQSGIECSQADHPNYQEWKSPVPMTIYEPGQLEQYLFYVTSDDFAMGKVCGLDKDGQDKQDAEYDAITNNGKFNQNQITALPQTGRYIFDYWDLNGERIENEATIPAGTLEIPYQGSRLTAHFKKNPNYQASDEEKEGRIIDKESLTAWLNELKARNVPLDEEGCTKTAELYDYENRIYRVDLTAKSNLSMFDGNIDLGFIIDVSGSMQFPSQLVPIPRYESVDVLHLNDNYYTQNSIDKSRQYFFIVDRTNTANVIWLKWGHWPTGNPSSSSTRWYDGWGISGYGYVSDEVVEASTRYYTSEGHALFGGDPGPFQLYVAGDGGKRRREYLQESIAGTIIELQSIMGTFAYAQDKNEASDVKVAYNTFANDVDYDHTNHKFISVTSEDLSIGYDYKGGTDTEEALNDARSFQWDDSATKVAVLITDGAPQQDNQTGPQLDAKVQAAADALKAQGVKLITVGLSMGDVKRGSRLLYDIATKDTDGDPYFYKAETGDELQYALYEVIQQVLADAIVVGNVTDTVNEAFYPVDKTTGLPLVVGDVINLDGEKIASNVGDLTDTQRDSGYGVIGMENDGNYNITWSGQDFTWDGWHGTVYEKAKEDFLGGNTVRTNDPDKPATIVAEGYKIHPEDPTITFKSEYQKTKFLETPRVNVNELEMTNANTEWTVYLGTEVDPKSQLEAFYNNVIVKEVVTSATDTDGDGFPDRMNNTSLHYPLLESMSDNRESSAIGEPVTFKLKDLLKKLNGGNDISVDDLITAGDNGITLPYSLYGQDCPGTIVVKLTKTGDTANYDPHITTETGAPVETYELSAVFMPNFDYVSLGQGGHGHEGKPYHTGDYSLASAGNAANDSYSINEHVINVYDVTLDVLKTDENGGELSGATFNLYKAGGTGTISGLSGSYTEVASGTSGADGIAHLTFTGNSQTRLVPGITYYLVETEAPENYKKVDTVWTVQVQTEIGKYTNLNNEPIYAQDYPFNWDQGARIVVDGQPVKVVTNTAIVTDGSYVSHEDAVSFQHTVQNAIDDIDIEVNKIWNDNNDTENRPGSVTVKLYRVSEKGHQWENGTIVPCTCTVNGVKEYTCSVCGKTDTHVITASGHSPGTEHQENYHAPTCTEAGCYDTVVRCTVCNAVIFTNSTEIPAAGHKWVNQETATSDPDHYCYDIAEVCSVCGAVNEETRVHHDHDWSAWQVTTPAQPGVAGEETRICRHNHTHIERQTIPALPTEHTVTIYFQYTGNGRGGTDYSGQVNHIAQRSNTGSGDMTIQWDWDEWTEVQPFDVDGLNGSSYSTSSTNDGSKYSREYENGRWVERGKRQTLTISNITQDLTIKVTIRNGGWSGTNDSLIYQPTFSGTPSTSNQPLSTAPLASFRGFGGKSLLNAAPAPMRSGEGGNGSGSSLPSFLTGITTKDQAACSERYWEEVTGTYNITAAGDWSLSISDLPKYNEYGKEYTYYVEEVEVPEGYRVTYSGQESGLKDEGAVNITNTKNPGNLELTKKVAGEGAETDKEFNFTITLTAPSGKILEESYTYTKTGLEGEQTLTLSRTDNNTKATVSGIKLKANDVYTIIGLPADTAYQISEADYTDDGYSASATGNLNGTISGGTTTKNAVEVTNTFNKGGLTVEKEISGSGKDPNKQFQFKVTIQRSNSASGKHGKYMIGQTVRDIVFTNGTAEVEFSLKGGEKAEFSNLQKNATFTVEEISADQDGYETTVTSTGGTIEGKEVSGTINKDSHITVVYTNKKETTTVEAAKQWKAGEQTVIWPEDVDKIELTLYKTVNGQTASVSATDVPDITNPVEITGSTEGQKAIWSNLPTKFFEGGTWYEAVYTVKETRIVYNAKSGKPEEERNDTLSIPIQAIEHTGQTQGIHQFTVTNELETTSISVTKQWKNKDGDVLDGTSGKEIPSGAQVTFTLYNGENVVSVLKEENGETVLVDRAVLLNGSDATSGGTVTPATDDYEARWTAYFTNLPKYDNDGKIIEYTVRETGTWTGYAIDGSNVASNGDTITNKEKSVTLDILKVDETGETHLANAAFELYRIDENSADQKDESTKQTAITDGKGEASFDNLTIGYYIITETRPPAGYTISGDDSFFIEVTDMGINLLTKGEGAPKDWAKNATNYGNVKTFTAATADANAQAVVENIPGMALPLTGSIGTTIFYILGLLMITGSGLFLVIRGYKRRKSNISG